MMIRPFAAAAALICLAAGAATPVRSAPATVRNVRFYTAPDHTRVVIDMSGPARYSVRSVAAPHRIVIELPSCVAAQNVENINVGDGVIERIRVNRLKAGAQIVLDVPRETSFNHFSLKAEQGRPDRIVLDLARTLSDAEIKKRRAEAKRIAESPGFVIALDAGHGGDDPGAVHHGIQEKTLNLRLARMLKEEIDRRNGYTAVLIRDGDYYIHWYKRILKAREHNADVLMSLHFNGHADRNLSGIELYIISPEGVAGENAEAVAEREHLMQEVQGQGAVVNGDLESILFDVTRTNTMQRSALLTEEVARVLKKDPPIPFRAVRQRNFVVLRGISMPSILVEGGYLSNKKDASIVAKDSYLRWLARSLADGVAAFLEKHPPASENAGAR
jgi:N-acetylmuramoyl-L-alanine amidase